MSIDWNCQAEIRNQQRPIVVPDNAIKGSIKGNRFLDYFARVECAGVNLPHGSN